MAEVYVVLFEIRGIKDRDAWNRSCSVYASEALALKDCERMWKNPEYRNVDVIARGRNVRQEGEA